MRCNNRVHDDGRCVNSVVPSFSSFWLTMHVAGRKSKHFACNTFEYLPGNTVDDVPSWYLVPGTPGTLDLRPGTDIDAGTYVHKLPVDEEECYSVCI